MIRHLINRGRPITLGGETYRAYQLTFRDFAELDDIAHEVMPSGFIAIYEQPKSEGYRSRLVALRKRIRQWDPSYFTATDLGLSHVLRLSLRLSSEVSGKMVLDLASKQEIDHLVRLAYGHDDVRYLARLLHGEEPDERLDESQVDTTTQIIDWACRTYGWTIDYVLSLTPNQLAICARSGKKRTDRGRQKPLSILQDEWDRKCRDYYGEDGE